MKTQIENLYDSYKNFVVATLEFRATTSEVEREKLIAFSSIEQQIVNLGDDIRSAVETINEYHEGLTCIDVNGIEISVGDMVVLVDNDDLDEHITKGQLLDVVGTPDVETNTIDVMYCNASGFKRYSLYGHRFMVVKK
jgi:hypothetical protein